MTAVFFCFYRACGHFASGQIMTDIGKFGRDAVKVDATKTPPLTVSHLKVIAEIPSRPFMLLWTTLVGILIGALPAIGILGDQIEVNLIRGDDRQQSLAFLHAPDPGRAARAVRRVGRVRALATPPHPQSRRSS